MVFPVKGPARTQATQAPSRKPVRLTLTTGFGQRTPAGGSPEEGQPWLEADMDDSGDRWWMSAQRDGGAYGSRTNGAAPPRLVSEEVAGTLRGHMVNAGNAGAGWPERRDAIKAN